MNAATQQNKAKLCVLTVEAVHDIIAQQEKAANLTGRTRSFENEILCHAYL